MGRRRFGADVIQEDMHKLDWLRWSLGLVFLIVALGASCLLMMKEMGVIGVSLPGCGEQSACGDLSRGFFGSVPGIGWPTSYVGFTFFLAMMVAWTSCWPRVPGSFVVLTRLGLTMSVVFMVVILIEWKLCPYCITAHLANIAFWIIVEFSKDSKENRVMEGSSMNTIKTFVLSWIVATIGLAIAQSQIDHLDGINRAAAEQINIDEIVKATLAGGVDPTKISDSGKRDGVFKQPEKAMQDPSDFGGRYLLGPENAPVQIVMVGDYQCPDCKRYEKLVSEIMKQRDDVSVSIRHFPFNTDCNPYVSRTMHGNACWASKFAETAGILGGSDAFWKAHEMLFEVDGKFTVDEFPILVNRLGFDPNTFQQVMVGPVVDAVVQEDIEIGGNLGVYFTPMIFVNGVQLKWWQNQIDIADTIDKLATAIKEGRDDGKLKAPLSVEEKYIDDWRTGISRRVPPDRLGVSKGVASAPHSVIVFSDYTDPQTKQVHEQVMEVMARYPGEFRYDIMASPKNPDCNSRVLPRFREMFPSGCIAAKAVKAAGKLGGKEAYWAMIEFFMDAGQKVTLPEIIAASTKIGLDRDEFIEMIESPEVQTIMETDMLRSKGWGMRSFPGVVVDGKLIPRWKLEDKKIVEQVMEIVVNEPDQ